MFLDFKERVLSCFFSGIFFPESQRKDRKSINAASGPELAISVKDVLNQMEVKVYVPAFSG